METKNDTRDREMIITRLINAPRNLVWEAWTKPEHIQHWWGPNGFTNTIHEMEVKPGGLWRFMMHGPDGTDFPNRIVFTEVVKPTLLSYDHGSEDPNDPNLFKTTVTFEEHNGKTNIVMKAVFATKEERERVVKEYGAMEGGNQTLAKLDEYLKTQNMKNPITVKTTVKAPVEKTWKFFTEPDHITKWYFASDDWHAPTAENDLRVDGKFKTHMAAKDGRMGFDLGGTYTNIVPYKTIEFVLEDGRKVSVSFTSNAGETTVTEIFEPESQNTHEMQRGGWQAILDNFKKHVEAN